MGRQLEMEGFIVRKVRTTKVFFAHQFLRVIFYSFLFIKCIISIALSDTLMVISGSTTDFWLITFPALIICQILGKGSLLFFRGGGAYVNLRGRRAGAKFVFRIVSKILVPSGYLAKFLRELGVDAKILGDILPLSDFLAFPRGKPKDALFMVSRRLEDTTYGISTIIRGFVNIKKVVPKSRLIILGNGPDKEKLRRLSADLGFGEKEVSFIGEVGGEEVARYIQEADIMLNASTIDNFPNAILEAMAGGLPIVSTIVGGIPWILEEGNNCLAFDVGDDVGMAKQAVRLLRDRVLYSGISRRNIARVQKLVWPLGIPGWTRKVFGR